MRNEIKKEKPPSNNEARSYISYIIGKFFKSYFKKFIYNISIGGLYHQPNSVYGYTWEGNQKKPSPYSPLAEPAYTKEE
jgi:hypothetical protein